MVRVIIEANGDDGQTTKQDIEADYGQGVVWYKDERVAEWKDGSMVLKGAAEAYKDALQVLMQ